MQLGADKAIATLLIAVLFLSSLSTPAHARIDSDRHPCFALFLKVAGVGSRLFLKNVREHPKTLALGFLRKHVPAPRRADRNLERFLAPHQIPIRFLTSRLKEGPYNFDLFGPLDKLVRPSTAYVGEELYDKPTGYKGKELNLLSSIALSILLATFFLDPETWLMEKAKDAADHQITNLAAGNVLADIEKRGAEWDRLLETDYRFRSILEQRKQGKISVQESRVAAYNQWRAIEDYTTFMNGRATTMAPEQVQLYLMFSPLFRDVTFLAEKGVPETLEKATKPLPGYAKTLTPEQVSQLISLQQLHLAAQDIISSKDKPPVLAEMRKDPTLRGFVDSILQRVQESPVTRRAQAMHHRGEISQNDLQRTLMEEEEIRFKIEQMKILKREMILHENGKPTQQPLTIARGLEAMVAELDKKVATTDSGWR